MSDTYRIKMKIGQHEFEAEGPTDVVQKQFQAFKDLIQSLPDLSLPVIPSSFTGLAPVAAPVTPAPVERPQNTELNVNDLSKIMKTDDRVISLTVRPQSLEDAALLILYGQKELRGNDLSTGGEVMQGLTLTGGYSVQRIDRILAKFGREGDVIVIGEHRSKRYRLTNNGLTKVRQIASALLTTVV